MALKSRPIRQMTFRQGPAECKIIHDHIDEILRNGIVEPSLSEWASPFVLAPKKNSKFRFLVDYRRMNLKTVGNSNPLPRMKDCIDSLGDAAVFLTIDCNRGYCQIPVGRKNRDKTTLTTF